jgi:integrase
VLGDRPVADIRRSEIVRMLDRIEDERGPAAADKTLAILRRVFNWHASRSDDFRSPIVRGMARTKPHERARSRVLTDDELRVVWHVAGDQGAFGRMIRFLLLTSARRTEAAGMPWSELSGADWLLPGLRNKTKLPLLRPLPQATLAQLPPKAAGPFVFSTDNRHTAICGYAELKIAFDRAVLAELRKADPDATAFPRWTLHDLRRTARSLMSRAGVPSDHAERVLGHVIGGVRGIYDRFEYRDEKADALTKLARLVDRIVSGRPTVVTLQHRIGAPWAACLLAIGSCRVGGASGGPAQRLINSSTTKMLCYNPLTRLNYLCLGGELSTMPSAWTMSTVEAAIFLSVVLGLAGAGAWLSVVG